MNRRDLLVAGLSASALTVTGAQAVAPTSSRLVIDAMAIGGAGSIDGPEVLAAGMDAIVLDMTIFPRALSEAIAGLEAWTARLNEPGVALEIVRRGPDIRAAREANKLGVILACQDASILGPSVISYSDLNLENLTTLHAAGLRILQLTHNERTGAGDGFMEPQDGGLSLLGRRVIEEMGRLGGLVDLSHCSERTTIEAIHASSGPVAVTHAGCRTLNASLRNKTDEAIRALADRGGFFGVFMMSRWLTHRDASSVEDVVDHIDHVVKVGGLDVVGFGSDQPAMGDPSPQSTKVSRLSAYQARNLGRPGAEPLNGHVTCADMDGPDRMAVLARGLSARGYSASSIDKIVGGNFFRVFSAATDRGA